MDNPSNLLTYGKLFRMCGNFILAANNGLLLNIPENSIKIAITYNFVRNVSNFGQAIYERNSALVEYYFRYINSLLCSESISPVISILENVSKLVDSQQRQPTSQPDVAFRSNPDLKKSSNVIKPVPVKPFIGENEKIAAEALSLLSEN